VFGFWAEIIGGFLEAAADVFTSSADTRRKDPLWLDLLVLLSPLIVTGAGVGFVLFLPWQAAVILTVAVAIMTLWGVFLLLKLPRKKRS
jgi:hypothetical protein